MNYNTEVEYLLNLIRNEVSNDPALKSKGSLLSSKVIISRSLESDSKETRMLKNFCRQWLRDHKVKYDPKRIYCDRAQYVKIGKDLITEWDKTETLNSNVLSNKFDFRHYGLKSSKSAIVFLVLNILIVLSTLKVLSEINNGTEFFFAKSDFLTFSATAFLISLVAGVFQTNRLNDLNEVLLKEDEIIIQRPYSLKFYNISDLNFIESKVKRLGLEKVEYYRFQTSSNEVVELSDKLLGIDALRERLKF